ncbi:Phosphatidylinositol-4-phosphate 5-kinase [Lithohypha guttulata]|nr:Phosphatidylinositol-4-phosphate 5-kinase [Lithohypha guttulata]
MPGLSAEAPLSVLPNSTNSSFDLSRKSNDKTISGVFAYTNGTDVETGLPGHRLEQIKNLRSGSQNSLMNGNLKPGKDRPPSLTSSNPSTKTPRASEQFGRYSTSPEQVSRLSNVENAAEPQRMKGTLHTPAPELSTRTQSLATQNDSELDDGEASSFRSHARTSTQLSSQPPIMTPIPSAEEPQLEPSKLPDSQRLTQRHTLNIPQVAPTAARPSRDFSYTSGPSEEVLAISGRFSPTRDHDGNTVRRRRASLGMVRRTTRGASDAHLDEVPPDEDAARWTEAIKQKRASRRKRQEEDDDRVIVGKRVEEGHMNWVTAYNMLTGIRFTVSRTNAKMDRDLTDADFGTQHKMSFDVTGSELTPSAKYDFKFKDYSPWVFRHLRAIFGLDPADYLMSLTSKYILSELGSPGKSGSFFYFSRDYKYIIKTIHHAEHKLLRKILKDYYQHVRDNPNTLISQFYGLHRVKVAYGRKIHFVVMNNLFPPHRDIHQTYDLKGSTVGRDLKEETLETNPRATLKDLNWLRRDMHLEFDQRLREIFIEQLQRDVRLLQRLKIMDYSLLVGIHDLETGNDANVREKTLKVFQPGGEKDTEDLPAHLMRTPSRLENARKAKELRETLKKEKPMPMGLTAAKMPEYLSAGDQRHNRIFYSDDGGIRATHEDGRPGETVYYLGVIDCLTHYGFIKRGEHFWKGLKDNRHQISPIPPQPYGERFLNFMTGIMTTKEEAERRAEQQGHQSTEIDAHNVLHHHHIPPGHRSRAHSNVDGQVDHSFTPHSPRNNVEVEKTLEAAEKSADKQTDDRKGRLASEAEKPDRTLLTAESATRAGTMLPVVTEDKEGSSRQASQQSSVHEDEARGERTTHSTPRMHEDESQNGRTVEYTVTSEDDDSKPSQQIVTPLDSTEQPQLEPNIENDTTENSNTAPLTKIPSRPPRIESGIVPTLDRDPLVMDEEVGLAR